MQSKTRTHFAKDYSVCDAKKVLILVLMYVGIQNQKSTYESMSKTLGLMKVTENNSPNPTNCGGSFLLLCVISSLCVIFLFGGTPDGLIARCLSNLLVVPRSHTWGMWLRGTRDKSPALALGSFTRSPTAYNGHSPSL